MTIHLNKINGFGGSGSGGGGSQATINFFDGTTGTSLDTQLTLGNSVFVFKNGVLLQPTEDYTISGSTITFVTALEATDKIAVINGNLNAINLTPYRLKATVVTDGDNTSLAVEANKIYKWTNAITTLNITSVATSDYESVLYFTTGTGSITFTAPNTLKWGNGGVVQTLEQNTTYCIAIVNGLAEIDSFATV